MIPPELVDAVRRRRAVLFVGAGISIGVGLPAWRELIRSAGEELGYDPDLFVSLGDYLALAEYYKLRMGSIETLRARIDAEWHSDECRVRVHESETHRLIVDLNFPFVYTTNYDRYLEWAFDHEGRRFKVIRDVDDLVDVAPEETPIVKYHGDLQSGESIVFTESSYFERMDFGSALDIKLFGDILGRVVLFLGYSLSDPNVRLLLFRLNRLWERSKSGTNPAKSYLFLSRPNPVQEYLWRHRGIVPIVADHDEPNEATRQFLRELRELSKT